MYYSPYTAHFFLRRAGRAIWVGVYCRNCGRVRTLMGLPPAVVAVENSGEKGLEAGIVSVVATDGVLVIGARAVFIEAPEVGIFNRSLDRLEADGKGFG